MSLLKIQNLTAGYGDKNVVQDISFTVMPGEVVGIIGPNGAGKTTLFRVITGVLTPASGEVHYRGQEIHQISLRERARRIAVLPQALPLTFPFTVEDFVLMGRLPYLTRWQAIDEADRKVAQEMMRLTEVQGLVSRHITELSGGELQRVLLTQALTQEPELLLLDEPTSHLDIGHQVEIMDLIRRLNGSPSPFPPEGECRQTPSSEAGEKCPDARRAKSRGVRRTLKYAAVTRDERNAADGLLSTASEGEERGRRLTILMVLHDLNLASEYCDRILLLNRGRIHMMGTPKQVLTYQNVEAVYKTVVVVRDNPITQRPHIVLVPKERWK